MGFTTRDKEERVHAGQRTGDDDHARPLSAGSKVNGRVKNRKGFHFLAEKGEHLHLNCTQV